MFINLRDGEDDAKATYETAKRQPPHMDNEDAIKVALRRLDGEVIIDFKKVYLT
jgi:hypothetical protein